MLCSNGHESPEGSRFCVVCGSSLASTCPNGHAIPGDVKYCGVCGSAILQDPTTTKVICTHCARLNDEAAEVCWKCGAELGSSSSRPQMERDLSLGSKNESGGAKPTAVSKADELRKFAELRDSGVISESEFREEKAKLLGHD
jgi:ribosomal protein L40E